MERFTRLVFLAALMSLMLGCGVSNNTTKPANETVYTYKDSTVIKDSVRLVDLPVERVVDIVAVYDTLELETSIAKARAWVDTRKHALTGNIVNKKSAMVHTEYKERVVYKDSVETKEIKVPVEVVVEKTKYPFLFWVLLVFAVIVIGKNVPKLVKAVNWLIKFDWKKLMFWKKNK